MKILVMSDIHRATDTAVKILYEHIDANAVIFLGDGERNFELAMAECGLDLCGTDSLQVFQVAGNCDWDSHEAMSLFPVIGGYKFCISHGHGSGVKSEAGRRALALSASSAGCKVALFGHTHQRYHEQAYGVEMFNPGAVQNRDYGIIMIDEHGIDFRHRSV